MTQIAIMGHGVVGCGVAELLIQNEQLIAQRAGDTVTVKRILDLRDFPGCSYAEKFTKNFEDIANDPDIALVVETMGGLHPAYDFVKTCLEKGKHVVTSNKELVAQKGDELLSLAKEKNLNFFFEASVGGGIPVLRPMHQCLAANDMDEVSGILNGTTNFMLTKMFDDGMAYADALKLAQELGYAEKDPTADVDGLDACRKICILAALAFGKHVYPDEVATEGIRNITSDDVQYASALGGVIKLIGHAKKQDGKVYCSVSPRIVPKDHMLSGVKDVFNAVMVHGNAVGDVLFYGRGAGDFPTASAVVADVMDAVGHAEKRKNLGWDQAETGFVQDGRDLPAKMLMRVTGVNGVELQTVFGDVFFVLGLKDGEIGFVTAPLTESECQEKMKQLPDMTVVSRIRFA